MHAMLTRYFIATLTLAAAVSTVVTSSVLLLGGSGLLVCTTITTCAMPLLGMFMRVFDRESMQEEVMVLGPQSWKYLAAGVFAGVMVPFMGSHYYPALGSGFIRELEGARDDEARVTLVAEHAGETIRLKGVVTAIRPSFERPFFVLQLTSGKRLKVGVAIAEENQKWGPVTPEHAVIEGGGWSYTLRKGQEVEVTGTVDTFRGMLRVHEAFIL